MLQWNSKRTMILLLVVLVALSVVGGFFDLDDGVINLTW